MFQEVEFKVSLGVPNWWSLYYNLNSFSEVVQIPVLSLNFSPGKLISIYFNTSLHQAPNIKWEQLQFHCPALSPTHTTFVLLM